MEISGIGTSRCVLPSFTHPVTGHFGIKPGQLVGRHGRSGGVQLGEDLRKRLLGGV